MTKNLELVQKTFGRLTIIFVNPVKGKNYRVFVTVKCICGTEKEVRLDRLVSGHTKSCGCLAKEIKKELKDRYGRLTVISEPYRKHDLVGRAMYVDVRCDCGTEKYVKAISLKSGITLSCGCLSVDTNILLNTTHGLSKHPLFKIWSGILGRCYTESRPDYRLYGAIGITVCDEWRYCFQNFYDWCILNGWESGMQIDKDIKGGKIYSPENCLIVTPKENGRHKSTTKLTMEDAQNIRSLYASGEYTGTKIATMYNVHNTIIYEIIKFKNWV